MKTDSALALLTALNHAPRLSLTEASRLTGLSRTALCAAADTLLDAGVLQESYGASASTRRPALHYTHGSVPAVTVLDMTSALPEINIFDGSLTSLAAAHTVYDETRPTDDNLRLLCQRAARLTNALGERLQAPPSPVLLIPHKGLPTLPGRPASPTSYSHATVSALLGVPPLTVLSVADAVACALHAHPSTAHARSILYISLQGAPSVLFFARSDAPTDSVRGKLPAPLLLLPDFFPLASSLASSLHGSSPADVPTMLAGHLNTLLRYCHSSVLFLDLPQPLPKSALRLPSDTMLLTPEPRARVSLPQAGAARYARRLCLETILSRLF